MTVQIKPLGTGLLLAAASFGLSLLLPAALVLDLHACLLAAIAAVYVGFAIADGRTSIFALESVVALVFVGLAAGGLYYNPRIMIAGWVAHAAWDLLHHNLAIPGQYAGWYIPLCLSFDVAVAIYLIEFL